ncbi:MAG TPA: EF-hand domain-containing protein [Thermohalobaculum sp.]|nr:EF-hand domain-containing protein [Thermohalobaculum sp.]
MKSVLRAAALSLLVLAAGTAPVSAQEINIYLNDDQGVTAGSGPHGKDQGAHARHGKHHGMRHDRHRDRGYHSQGGDEMHHGSHARHGGKWGHHRRLGRVMDLIEQYDRDGDGKVTQAEIDQGRADRLAEFDRDGDGMLSLQEYEALWLDAMRERMVDRFQSHDDDGDGQVTVEEFSERTGRLVLRRDRNEDGAIGLDDLRRGAGERHGMNRRNADDE